MLTQLGHLLRAIHDAGGQVGRQRDAIRVVLQGSHEELLFDPLLASGPPRKSGLTDHERLVDCEQVVATLGQRLSRTDAARFALAYCERPAPAKQHQQWKRHLIQHVRGV
jgi:hypothetical protein